MTNSGGQGDKSGGREKWMDLEDTNGNLQNVRGMRNVEVSRIAQCQVPDKDGEDWERRKIWRKTIWVLLQIC